MTKPQPNQPFNPAWFTVADFNRLWDDNKSFRDYARQVYHYLDTMRAGRRLDLTRYANEKLKWIVITAVAFISEGTHFLTYEFTNDLTAIRKIEPDPWMEQQAKDYKYGPLNIEEK